LGNARVEVIEGAGHMVQMEKANRVNEMILVHIARQTHGSERV
jgi:pyruvate dehydrogenase E2 component (dihydrolipoamide acetyltransferase)